MKCAAFLLIAIVMCVGAVACHHAGPLSDQDKAAIQKQHDQYVRTLVAQDPAPADLVKAYYADEAQVLPPNAPAIQDREQLVKLFTAPGGPAKTFSFDKVTIDGREDLAYAAGLWQADWKLPTGGTQLEKGKFVETWKKQADGTWKALHTIWNSDLPAGLTVPTGAMKADASPELKKMAAFAGSWKLETDVKASPTGPAGKSTIVMDCRWLMNGQTLFCRNEGAMPGGPYQEVFLMSYDPEAKAYTAYDVDNAGVMAPVALTSKDKVWTMTWDLKTGGKPLKIRAALEFLTNDAWSMKQEYSTGGAWAPLMDSKATRIGSQLP